MATETKTRPKVDGLPVTQATLRISGQIAVDPDDERFAAIRLGRRVRATVTLEGGSYEQRYVVDFDTDEESAHIRRAARVLTIELADD